MKLQDIVNEGYSIVTTVNRPADERGCTGYAVMTKKLGAIVCVAAKYRDDEYTIPVIMGVREVKNVG